MSENLIIHIEKLHKVYILGKTQVHALRGIDLEVSNGEYISIMGPSGSGKSTLMNIIGCLDVSTTGSYRLNEQDVSGLNDNELAKIRNKEIGFVFQTFNLLPRASALHNVELPLIYNGTPASRRKENAKQALEKVGLGDRMNHKPNELSGGERQRVAIARAIVNKPAIILADEPTGNLDTHTSIDIISVLQELNDQGITIILVMHEHHLAEYAKHIVKLRDGRVVSNDIIKNRKKAMDAS